MCKRGSMRSNGSIAEFERDMAARTAIIHVAIRVALAATDRLIHHALLSNPAGGRFCSIHFRIERVLFWRSLVGRGLG